MTKRNFTRSLLGASALFALAVTHPTLAQDNNNSGDGDDDTVETVLLLSALGLSAPDGTTELAEGTGALESHMLLAPMLNKFGTSLSTALTDHIQDGDKVIVLAGDQSFSLSSLALVESRLAVINTQIGRFTAQCGADRPLAFLIDPGDGAGAAIDGSFTGIATTIIDLLRTDKKITNVDLDPSEELLVNAASAHKPAGDWLIPGGVIYVSNPRLLEEYAAAAQAITDLKNRSCPEVIDSEKEAFLNSVSQELQALSQSGEGGAGSLLEQAMLLEPFVPQGGGALKVLHLSLETAGGTVEQRSSILTTLGLASGIRISGGMVGSYRLTNGTDGSVVKSGTFFCRAPIRSFGDAHRPSTRRAGDCTVH